MGQLSVCGIWLTSVAVDQWFGQGTGQICAGQGHRCGPGGLLRKHHAAGARGCSLRISRELGGDFARSRARVSRHRGQPFRRCGQAGRRFHGVRL